MPQSEPGTGNKNNLPNKDVLAVDAYDLKKKKDYSRYKTESAADEAKQDIRLGAIKLFYLDAEEVPELIAIDEDPAKLPAHKDISIGSGCTDTIHADDCPAAYRAAMQNALTYALRYNKIIASHFKLKLKAEPDLLPGTTLDFFGLPDKWQNVQMELRDIQPMFGGRDIWVAGSGTAFVRSVRPGSEGLEEKIYRLPPDMGTARRILLSCCAHDIIALNMPDESAPPDHGRPKLIFTNAGGSHHGISAWAPPLPGGDPAIVKRFQAVYREFLRLETAAKETLSPLHTGRYGENTNWADLLKKQGG